MIRRGGLGEAEIWLRTIFESSPVAYYLVDLTGVLIDVNEAAAKLFGYSREELKGKKVSELNIITPNQLAKLESSINNWKKGKPSGPNEYILNRKDGSQVFVEVQGFPVKYGDKNLALALIHDVTIRKLAEICFRFQSNLLDAVSQAVLATDLKGRIIYWNKFAETLYGWKASEIIGAKLRDNIPIKTWVDDDRTAKKRLGRKETRSGEILVRRKDGTAFPAMVSITPLRDPKENLVGFVGISYDISAQKQAHEIILRQHKALKHFARRIFLAREEEKRRISLNLHGEIGHITGAINLLSGSLEKNIKNNNLKAALESCQKFRAIFNDFVSNLRRLALEMRPPELDILGLSSALGHYLSNIEKKTGLRIDFRSSVNDKKIQGNLPIVVFRIVQEAVNNILKHSRANRVIVVLKSQRRTISLAIKDNGLGFDPKKNSQGGESAMGLRLIREMVESLNGTLEIHSSPGKGTKILVTLPAERPAERDSGLRAEAAGGATPAPESAPKSDPLFGRRGR